MICETCKPLLSEYTDGRIDAGQSRQIEAHLAHCPACAALAADFRTVGGLLRGLPLAQTSARFDARLADRLVQTGPVIVRTPWLSRLADRLRPVPALWRPAIALGTAAVTVAGVLVFQHPAAVVDPAPSAEGALVTQCVQQHRSYVGAQPLSDPAAQTLANRLDDTNTALPAPLLGENDL